MNRTTSDSQTLALSLVILLGLAFGGCADAGGADSSRAVVRDSAGIRIVENTTPRWGRGEGWRLSPEPVLEIGMVEGSREYLLDRVTGARRLSDGSVVIANAGSNELRYYDLAGRHLRSVGGTGEGPGEFSQIAWLYPYRGDSLAAFDGRVRRITILSADGEFGRVLNPAPSADGGPPLPLAPFADGSVLGRMLTQANPGEMKTGMRSSNFTFGRLSAEDGALVDTLATVSDGERHVTMEPTMIMINSPLLGPQAYFAAAGDSVFLGNSAAYEVASYGHDGTLRHLIRRRVEPVPVAAADLDALLQDRLEIAMNATHRDEMEQALRLMPPPEVRPAYAALATDDGGNLWVKETAVPGEPNGWTVFDPEGRLLGTLTLPDDYRPLHIGADFVLGVVTDDLGVERVRMYGIQKGT